MARRRTPAQKRAAAEWAMSLSRPSVQAAKAKASAVMGASGGSWWVGVDRDELQARAQQEQARMSVSDFGRNKLAKVWF